MRRNRPSGDESNRAIALPADLEALPQLLIDHVALAWNHGFSARELNVIRQLIVEHEPTIIRHGMSTAVRVESRIDRVEVTDETITAHLVDGRVISVPLAWSWRLSDATPAQRANWELIGDGHGVHWPDIDEDISADGMLGGIPAHRPKTQLGTRATADRTVASTKSGRRTAKSKTRKRVARN